MAVPRRSGVRGSVVRGESGKGTKSSRPEPLAEPEDVADPALPRSVVDFALQRRSALYTFFNGGALSSEFCDADTYLLRAAKFHGEPAPLPCPVCRDLGFVTVTYVYGDELGPYSGRVRQSDELGSMATQFGRFKVYVVEVCQRCHWNYLTKSYVLGDGVPRRALPASRDLMEA